MGGARSQKEMRTFLACMFKDPRILPFGKVLRKTLAFIISNVRYKKSWKKYELIGGTPLIDATQATALALQTRLNNSFNVKMAFSYTSPTIEESLLAFKNEGINKITVIPLYPQASFSTTGSVQDDLHRITSKENTFDIRFENEFYQHKQFVNFWSELILKHIKDKSLSSPYLLFSAHSIPQYLVDKGDTYPQAITESAKLIAGNLGLDFEVCYQSGIKGSKWVGPDVMERLKSLAAKVEIIIIPISFINENLETLYDIDKVIIPFGTNELGIKQLSRVNIPVASDTFLRLLEEIVRK
jgi:ferrochelatase